MVFGFTQSPFVLIGTLKIHFENYRHGFEETVNKTEKDMEVDDLLTEGNALDEVRNVKEESVNLFQKGVFILRKWHCNTSALESNNDEQSELTYAK